MPQEKLAKKLSLTRAAEFLDGAALAWTREHNCVTCHTNVPYLMARPALKNMTSSAYAEVRKFLEDRVAGWETETRRWDTAAATSEVVVTATALVFNDAQATGKLHPSTRKALDRMWTLQRDDGSWDWLKCDWPPLEHDDYYGATFAALAAGSAPEGYAQSEAARQGLDKLRKYFQANRPPYLHHKTMLLWASLKVDGLMTPADRDDTIIELYTLQREDGGWSLPSLGDWKRHDGSPNDKQAPSDGYGTGLVIYVLRQAGVPTNDERIQRGITWLKSNQRTSGCWFTRSLNNDKGHYITNAGTAYAIMALDACGLVEK